MGQAVRNEEFHIKSFGTGGTSKNDFKHQFMGNKLLSLFSLASIHSRQVLTAGGS
jgi:hypothetical protein